MINYKLSNQAKDDLIRIHQFGTARFGAAQADKYFDALFEQFEKIASRPLSFEAVDYIKPGYRRCVCGVNSIFYRMQNGSVEIMAIIGRQAIDRIFR